LGIVCSPRKGGNTEILLKEVLKSSEEAGAQIKILLVAGRTIKPCDGCESCLKTGKCHIKDDMEKIYPKLLQADAIILGTPTYFWSLSAQAKAIIDRTHCFYHSGRKLRGKVGGVVITAKRLGGTSAFSVFNDFFILQRMVMAGGVIGIAKEKGGILEDKAAITEARALGRAVVRYIKSHRRPAGDTGREK